MTTIWKFQLPVGDCVSITMPEGAKVLSLHCQGGKPCLWAMVDPEAKTEKRDFRIFGTGHPIPQQMGTDLRFVGTFLVANESLVFHVFEDHST